MCSFSDKYISGKYRFLLEDHRCDLAQAYAEETPEELTAELDAALTELQHTRRRLENTEKDLDDVMKWGIGVSGTLFAALTLVVTLVAYGVI